MTIDLNCDMGEGMSTDALIMPYISSANIACGGHAGDAALMEKTIRLAKQHKVAIGAHPSYPDRRNFGRIEMDLSEKEIYNEVYAQIQVIQKIALAEGLKLHHVKPHGALYNTAAKNEGLSDAIANAIVDIDPSLKVYGLPLSSFETICIKKGLNFIGEGFADRSYSDDGTLSPRSLPGALITDTTMCIEQVKHMVIKQEVKSTSGKWVKMPVQTICIHGDGEHAVDFAIAIHESLKQNNITITY
jgi:5-oxoprolinase (ATP-hydrolysing) subunit A